jgi:NAD(P)-dependent dehydrogenase (short-subunit alcohol dehydrogenase family)
MYAPVVLISAALTGLGRATGLAFAHEQVRSVIAGHRQHTGQAFAV